MWIFHNLRYPDLYPDPDLDLDQSGKHNIKKYALYIIFSIVIIICLVAYFIGQIPPSEENGDDEVYLMNKDDTHTKHHKSKSKDKPRAFTKSNKHHKKSKEAYNFPQQSQYQIGQEFIGH